MAEQHLNKIFLSASIPYPERDKKFYDTADIIAIRDAVRAMATVVIPKAHLIWGGHPSITPLIRFVMEKMNADLKRHVTLYQSAFFEDKFPVDNFSFENIMLTEKRKSSYESLLLMRTRLFSENNFKAAIFIGGMEGVIDEYDLFKLYHPDAIVLPIASTGAAARILFDKLKDNLDKRLLTDYAYMSLFRYILNDYI
jgi:SLOG cluster3 family